MILSSFSSTTMIVERNSTSSALFALPVLIYVKNIILFSLHIWEITSNYYNLKYDLVILFAIPRPAWYLIRPLHSCGLEYDFLVQSIFLFSPCHLTNPATALNLWWFFRFKLNSNIVFDSRNHSIIISNTPSIRPTTIFPLRLSACKVFTVPI